MFAEDGTLMATASQSCIVRYWKVARRTAWPKVARRWHSADTAWNHGALPGHLHTHREQLGELADLGYTDIWSAESDGGDGLTPLALAAAWEPRLRLGTAILPAFTRALRR